MDSEYREVMRRAKDVTSETGIQFLGTLVFTLFLLSAYPLIISQWPKGDRADLLEHLLSYYEFLDKAIEMLINIGLLSSSTIAVTLVFGLLSLPSPEKKANEPYENRIILNHLCQFVGVSTVICLQLVAVVMVLRPVVNADSSEASTIPVAVFLLGLSLFFTFLTRLIPMTRLEIQEALRSNTEVADLARENRENGLSRDDFDRFPSFRKRQRSEDNSPHTVPGAHTKYLHSRSNIYIRMIAWALIPNFLVLSIGYILIRPEIHNNFILMVAITSFSFAYLTTYSIIILHLRSDIIRIHTRALSRGIGGGKLQLRLHQIVIVIFTVLFLVIQFFVTSLIIILAGVSPNSTHQLIASTLLSFTPFLAMLYVNPRRLSWNLSILNNERSLELAESRRERFMRELSSMPTDLTYHRARRSDHRSIVRRPARPIRPKTRFPR